MLLGVELGRHLLEHVLCTGRYSVLPLLHELLAHFCRILKGHELGKIEDLGPELGGERRELVLGANDPRLEDLVLDPLALLRGDVGGGRDALGRIDEEEDEDLAVAGLGRVDEAERRDLVLKDVREADGATGRGEE